MHPRALAALAFTAPYSPVLRKLPTIRAEAKEVRDGTADNELLYTVFVPTPETLRVHPRLTGYELHLLND